MQRANNRVVNKSNKQRGVPGGMRGFTLLVIVAAQHVAQKRADLQRRERDARACIFDGRGVGRQRGSGGPRLATLEQVAAQLQNAS